MRTSNVLNPIQEHPQPNPLQRKPDASGLQSGCTTGCTIEAENTNADPLAGIAATLLALSPADRARLAAMLTGQNESDAG
jgi:hypothetical protein